MRNLKAMWGVIAMELSTLDPTITAKHCENRFRVLERNFKKFVDGQNKTGRGRKHFEFEQEMQELMGDKSNYNPKLC